MSDVVPFLTALSQQPATTPFARAVPTIAMPAGASPWGPQPQPEAVAPAASATPAVDIEAITAAARDAGRAAGEAETAALRAQLATLIAQAEATRARALELSAELVADAATAVVRAWVGQSDAVELFQPLVRSWLAATQAAAMVHVHPDQVEAMRAAVGAAALTVQADAGVAMGDARFASPTLELAHSWEQRLGELREVIAAALAEPAA